MNFTSIKTVGALALAAAAVAVMNPQPAISQDFDIHFPSGARIVTANGTGMVRTAPDEAVIVLGVETWNKDLRAGYSENEAIVKRVLAVPPKYHIDKKDVQTNEVSVESTHQSRSSSLYESGSKPNGYRIDKKITVVVKDLGSVPALLADAIDAGANTIDSLNFGVSNPRKYKDEARALAINAAKEKAEAMAAELHAKIGKPVVIKEIGSNTTGLGLRRDNAVINMFQEASDASPAGIASGQLKIDASVSVTFELTD